MDVAMPFSLEPQVPWKPSQRLTPALAKVDERDEAMRDAVAFATRDHVDAWYTADGQAYESMARRRVQQRRG
jgi:hypothetical protein